MSGGGVGKGAASGGCLLASNEDSLSESGRSLWFPNSVVGEGDACDGTRNEGEAVDGKGG